ncbi:hypothetical protein [Jiangella alkaliphila]|uniref:Uncharacterized protein n=1 Tax=Jiangella alkaliphila TaxID=419479 RepID=A0A1H2L9C4_9ACTN|nr:hypothetical protein [Jiangella alkaliphila]SDU77432.1 hypothetical protein SAMN04488563_5543 [Jiangella alkaliphila]
MTTATLTTTPARPGPVRRAIRAWPRWTPYAAAAWSAAYGLLGLLWALGVGGYPFGPGDIEDAREESLLGATTAAGTGPWIAGLGLTGALVALMLARMSARGVVRVALAGWAWANAVLLVVLVPDQRILTTVAYTPLALVGIPFGWPPMSYAEFAAKMFPWPNVNHYVCVVGGLLWAATALAFQRRTVRACVHCGRRAGHAHGWTSPAGAGRWGRWAAYAAFLMPFGYALVRWAWALGVPLTISQDFLDELHESGLVWAGAYLATFAAAGGVLTLGLTQRWGIIWPRWVLGLAGKPVPRAFPLVFATVVALSLASAGSVILRLTDWSDPAEWAGSPMTLFAPWAVVLGAATFGYYLRTRGACRVCGRSR